MTAEIADKVDGLVGARIIEREGDDRFRVPGGDLGRVLTRYWVLRMIGALPNSGFFSDDGSGYAHAATQLWYERLVERGALRQATRHRHSTALPLSPRYHATSERPGRDDRIDLVVSAIEEREPLRVLRAELPVWVPYIVAPDETCQALAVVGMVVSWFADDSCMYELGRTELIGLYWCPSTLVSESLRRRVRNVIARQRPIMAQYRLQVHAWATAVADPELAADIGVILAPASAAQRTVDLYQAGQADDALSYLQRTVAYWEALTSEWEGWDLTFALRDAYQRIGFLACLLGNPDEADNALSKSIVGSGGPLDWLTVYNLAQVKALRKQWAAASRSVRQSHRMAKDYSGSAFMLVHIPGGELKNNQHSITAVACETNEQIRVLLSAQQLLFDTYAGQFSASEFTARRSRIVETDFKNEPLSVAIHGLVSAATARLKA